MLSNTQFSSLPTQISRNGKQQISLFLIAHKMRRLKELDAIKDEAEILEEVLNCGLTKTLAILDELPKILGLNLEENDPYTLIRTRFFEVFYKKKVF